MEDLGAQARRASRATAREVGALGVAVERRVEVRAGVADHRDDVHRELGARRVPRARVLAREVRRDRRRGKPGIGDEPRADRVAEVDDAGATAGGRGIDHVATAAVRLLDDAQAPQLDLVDEREPEVLHEQQPDLVGRRARRTAGRAGSRCRRAHRRWRSGCRSRSARGTGSDEEAMPRQPMVDAVESQNRRSAEIGRISADWSCRRQERLFRRRTAASGRTSRYPRSSSNPPITSPSARWASISSRTRMAPGRGILRGLAPQRLDVVRHRDRGDHALVGRASAPAARRAPTTP